MNCNLKGSSEAKEFYMGRKRYINRGFWMSFENDPYLRETKSSIYRRCVPCLEKLSKQLKESPRELVLDEPLSCWKVVVVVESVDAGLNLLELYQDRCLPLKEVLRGRLGTGNSAGSNIAIIFNVHDEKLRDELCNNLKFLAGILEKDYPVYIERGCGDIYVPLCGKWETWKEKSPIVDLKAVPVIASKVDKLLRGEF